MQRKILLVLTLMLSLCTLHAKEKAPHAPSLPFKIGYVNVEYVVGLLPETKIIKSEYTSFEKQIQNKLEGRLETLQQKAQAFQEGYETMTEALKEKKQAEFQQLKEELERLQLESQDKLSSKRNDLFKPVYEKVRSAIEQVAKEHGYTYILSQNLDGIPVLLYADEQHNISDRVLKKLGSDPGQASKKP